jgi:hypothetical protein
MPPKKEMYLVRGGDGQMRTIMATSPGAAAKEYIRSYPVCEGDSVSVKKRGSGSWEEYEIR